MITKMTKYSFILLSEDTGDFLKRLQELGLVDISRSKKPVDAGSSAILDRATAIKKAVSILNKTDFNTDADAEAIKTAAANAILPEDAVKCVSDTVAEIERLHTESGALNDEMKKRLPWGEFDSADLKKLSDLGYTVRWYVVSKKKFSPEWGEQYPLQVVHDNGSSVWFVTVTPASEQYSFPVEETAAPAGDWRESERELKETSRKLIEAKGLLLKLKDRIPELRKAYDRELDSLDLYLADATKETAADNMITVLQGFAPAENDEALCAEFDRMDIAYFKEDAVESDNPPIKLKNNRFTRMFEVLTGMYGMPVYSEFDPTPILGPFFMLFFAMCMGDAGYGILLAILGIVLTKSKGSLSNLGPIVTTLGTATIVVGFILGTFFGIPLPEASWVPEWMKKCMITGEIAGYSAQMVLALGIGVLHICLAMTVKAICYTRRFGFKENISTWAWLILILGVIVIAALALLEFISMDVTKWAVIVLGVICALGIYIFNVPGRNPLINIGSGLWDTYNMATGLLGDVLSYLRLYALGLAGGMLGDAFNNLGMMVVDGLPVPGLNWLCFALIVVLGHALNIAMSCLGAFVHPLRLTFVEYFKNSGYEGAGKAYNPLTIKENNN